MYFLQMTKNELDLAYLRLFSRTKLPMLLVDLEDDPHRFSRVEQEGLSHLAYYSIFDQIQGVEDRIGYPLSMQDFLSEGQELVWTPWGPQIYQDRVLRGRFIYSDLGRLQSYQLLHQGQLHEESLIDDRGFLSAQVFYQGGEAIKKRYYRTDGRWILDLDLQSGRVQVSLLFAHLFDQLVYESMSQVLAERLLKDLDFASPAVWLSFGLGPDFLPSSVEDLQIQPQKAQIKGRIEDYFPALAGSHLPLSQKSQGDAFLLLLSKVQLDERDWTYVRTCLTSLRGQQQKLLIGIDAEPGPAHSLIEQINQLAQDLNFDPEELEVQGLASQKDFLSLIQKSTLLILIEDQVKDTWIWEASRAGLALLLRQDRPYLSEGENALKIVSPADLEEYLESLLSSFSWISQAKVYQEILLEAYSSEILEERLELVYDK